MLMKRSTGIYYIIIEIIYYPLYDELHISWIKNTFIILSWALLSLRKIVLSGLSTEKCLFVYMS